jgi:hypothetical protein
MAGQPLNDIASSLLKVIGSQQLETRHEPGKVVGDARLNETVYAALLVELDVRNLAAENFGKNSSNLCVNRWRFAGIRVNGVILHRRMSGDRDRGP